jgi:hypothetical protein
MSTSTTDRTVSRRTALAGLGAGGLGLALTATPRLVAAQDTAAEMAKHPILGVWNVTTPNGPNVASFFADGTAVTALPTTSAGPQGVQFVSALVGTWEPISARGIHFTAVLLQSDANGTYTGSVTIDGHPVVSEDGQTLVDDAPETTVTIRDAAGTIVAVIPGTPTVHATAIRMGVGAPGFPAATPGTATPAP